MHTFSFWGERAFLVYLHYFKIQIKIETFIIQEDLKRQLTPQDLCTEKYVRNE